MARGNGSSGALSLVFSSDTLTRGVEGLGPFMEKAITAACHFYAPQVESYARLNAPWTDRTSNARNGLIARAFKEGKTNGIALAHQVPYGIWLEVRWSGKYAVIMPTIDVMGPKVLGTINNTLARYRGR